MATNDEIRAKDVIPQLTDFRDDTDGFYGDGSQSSFFMKALYLVKSILGRIHLLTNTKYSGFIALDDADGAGKYLIDNLFKGMADLFDPSRTTDYSYKPGEFVVYSGIVYQFIRSHYGAWDASNVIEVPPTHLLRAISKAFNKVCYDGLTVPYLDGHHEPLLYFKGAKYRFTNTGTAGFSLYLMRAPTNRVADVATVLAPDYSPLAPGSSVDIVIGDNFFLYVNAFSRVGEGGKLKVELLNSLGDAWDSIHEIENNLGDLSTDYLNVTGFSPFSEDADYVPGSLVKNQDTLYMFTRPKDAGAWDSSKTEAVSIADIYDLESKKTRILTVSDLSVPYLDGNRAKVPYFKGAKYRFTNTGTAGFSLYLMFHASNRVLDVSYTIAPDNNPIMPGQSIVFEAGDKFFLYVNAFSRVGEGGKLKVELLNSLEGASKLNLGSFAILGDSYSTYEGYIPDSSWECWYGPNKRQDFANGVKDTWWFRLADALGITLFQDNSYSGATMSNSVRSGYPLSSSFVNRAIDYFGTDNAIKPKPDTIFIFGATNDSWFDKPIGEVKYSDWTETDLLSVLPAFCYIVDYLKKWNPSIKIVNITNSLLKDSIKNGFATACAHYNIINVALGSFEVSSNHPTASGMEYIMNRVLDSLIE